MGFGQGRPKRPRSPHRPRWDQKQRILYLGDTVVKVFRQPCRNQELILDSFEELDWPPQIDDPLPGDGNANRKQRLHDTIINLNLHQLNELIRFHGDGTGTAIWWESV